jgi:hypothetical protein
MSRKSVAIVGFGDSLCALSLSSASAAKHARVSEPTGACAQQKRPLRLRLRSVQLVHGVYLPKRQIDTSAILALLSAQRAVPRAALLIVNLENNLLSDRSLRSS